MDGGSTLKTTLFVVCLVLSAFFSSTEAAFLSVQRIRLSHLVSQGVPGARRVKELLERPERLLSTILLGNNLVNTAAAAIGTAIVLDFVTDPNVALLVSTALVTLVVLVFGEVVPKSVAARRAEGVAMLASIPMRGLMIVATPLTAGLERLSRLVSRMLGYGDRSSVITEAEIRAMITVGREAGAVEHHEARMIEKVFRFGDRPVREVMTPRTEVVWAARDTTLKDFLELYVREGHSRYPFYGDSVDNVVGILSTRDVLTAIAEGAIQPNDPVLPLARLPVFYPESKTIGALFRDLGASGEQMAILVDEYGGVAGLVTLKQLMEEIVGPIGEEGEPAEKEVEAIDRDTFEVDGTIGIPEVNESLALQIPEGDYETLAGFLLHRLGHIPSQGEVLVVNGVRFKVSEMRDRKIERVEVHKPGQASHTQEDRS